MADDAVNSVPGSVGIDALTVSHHPTARFYTAHCDFNDGSRSTYDGLTLSDLLALVGTFDNLSSLVECSIGHTVADEIATPEAVARYDEWERRENKVTDLVAALEESLVAAKTANEQRRAGLTDEKGGG